MATFSKAIYFVRRPSAVVVVVVCLFAEPEGYKIIHIRTKYTNRIQKLITKNNKKNTKKQAVTENNPRRIENHHHEKRNLALQQKDIKSKVIKIDIIKQNSYFRYRSDSAMFGMHVVTFSLERVDIALIIVH